MPTEKMLTNYTILGAGALSTLSTLLGGSSATQTTTVSPTVENNASNITQTDELQEEEEQDVAKQVVIGTLLSLMVFLAVSGNTLVCIAVFTDRKLKRLNNLFIVSLAVADLWMSLVVMPFAVVNDVANKWMFGPVFCNIWIASDIMGSTASILNLCVISLDRYIHIRDPLKYARLMNAKKVACAIALVWVISIILSFIPIHVGWHKGSDATDEDPPPGLCIFEISGTYAVVSSSISFYFPCIVMLAIYCKLYMYAREQVKSIKSTFVHNHLSESQTKQASGLSDHKAAVTLGIIMGTFLFCWLPFFILNLVEAYCKCAPPILFKILTWLGYFNSCLNPIIYSIFNSEFRNAFKRILFPKSCTCIHDDRNDFYRSPKKSKNGSTTSTLLMSRIENGSKANHDSKHPLMEEKITAL